MIDLTGKVALVTGGSRGVGRTIAWRLAQAGADVVLNFLQAREEADHTAEQIAAWGRRVAEVQADVSEPEDIQTMLAWIGETFGRLDILVHNATERVDGRLLETVPERFTTAMNTNARAMILLAQGALPLFQAVAGRSKVIAISSLAAEWAAEGWGVLGASKAALESVVRHLALELGPRGINVNAVQVGMINGLRAIRTGAEAGGTLDASATLPPQAIADAVLFLASSLSDHVQGQTLVVDAGASICRGVGCGLN